MKNGRSDTEKQSEDGEQQTKTGYENTTPVTKKKRRKMRMEDRKVREDVYVCRTCHCERHISEFYKVNDRRLRSECVRCCAEKAKKRWREDKNFRKRGIERSRKYALKVQYGLTPECYDRMMDEQNHCCAICNRHVSENGDRVFAVDHCHETGQNRQLLCHNCNALLGHSMENVDILEKAIKYVKEWHEKLRN